jgi:hypothetical protein
MSNRNLKHSLRSTLASLALASSLTGVVAACSADTPTVTQVPSSISVQAPEAATAEGVSFYYEGTKTSVKITDAAVLFAACTLKTSDTTKIVDFVNKTLKAGPIQDSDVTGLGDPLKPAISDFTGDGTVDCKDAAVLFAVATLGTEAPAAKVNGFLSGTLKLPEVNVTQTQLDTFFKTPPTPTPTPPPTPTPTPTSVFFFIDPVNGSDTNLGTAIEPFKTVEYALATSIVSSAANTTGSGTDGGTDVTVTIVGSGIQNVSGPISTPNLTRGSVTVVGPSNFNLNLNGNLLTLNKGYRLKGFRITSGNPGGTGTKAAITLAGVGTSLNNMEINCAGLGTAGVPFTDLGDRCIEVTAEGGTITLKGLEVQIPGSTNYIAAIVHKGSDTTLGVVDSTIRTPTGSSGGQGIVGVLGSDSAGPVIVQSSTVDFLNITSGTNGAPTIAVWLNVGGSKVLGPSSRIKLNGDATNHPKGAIGIKASHSSGTVRVDGTTFSTGNDGAGIGIKKAGTGSLDLGTNNFPTSGNLLNVNVSY